jgi:hypothetical protein
MELIWTILMWVGGISIGSAIIGQIYAWWTGRSNPVWDALGGIAEGIGDIAESVVDGIGDIGGGGGSDSCGGGDCGGGD